MSVEPHEVETQRRYYAETAEKYDELHIDEKDEHSFALSLLTASLDYLDIRSILDIGSGTGRVISHIKKHRPDIRVVGIEPVKELREIGYAKGLLEEELVDGDATNLQFGPSEFDLVCEFAVLHHIHKPENAVAEMLRVANKAIFISDSNNFGQGAPAVRKLKQIINFLGLWKLFDLVKTKGKGYTITEGDGLAYSYSVYNNYRQIRSQCSSVHILNTTDGNINPYRTSDHIALLGILDPQRAS